MDPQTGATRFRIPAGPPAPGVLSNPDEAAAGQHHRDAADTERAAARLQFPKSGIDRRKVLDFIAGCGDRGATDEEIMQGTGLLRYTAAPRRNELLNGGWVEDSGKRRRLRSRSSAIVWRLTGRGRYEYARRNGT